MKNFFSKFLIAFLFFGLLQLHFSILRAQDNGKDSVYNVPDVLPGFNGDYALYLKDNIQYPPDAANNNIQGTVYAEITIDKNGKVEDVAIKKDIGGGCGEEVKRMLYAMPDWEPGKQNGSPVSVRIVIPVKFTLQDDKVKKGKKKNYRSEKAEEAEKE